MATVTSKKCACDRCVCVVSEENAVEKDGKYYCCQACANGHVDGSGCGHEGCNC